MIRSNKTFPAYLTDVYPYEESTRTFTIPVSIAAYKDLFKKIDHSPIHRKDLSYDLVSFLSEGANEIPESFNLEIAIHVSAEKPAPKSETEVLAGMHHYFSYLAEQTLQEKMRIRRRAMTYVLVSFLFITAAVLTHPWMERSILLEIMNEGLHIGGWVFLWEAFSVSFISIDTINATIQQSRRLDRAPVFFHYEQS